MAPAASQGAQNGSCSSKEQAGPTNKVVPTLVIKEKPKLRGVSHSYAVFAFAAAGAVLIADTHSPEARLSAAVYVASLIFLFGTSSIYHMVTWKDQRVRDRIRALDHSAIFALIAGTYTPICALGGMSPEIGTRLLKIVWAGAALGSARCLLLPRIPRPLAASTYIALGWVAVSHFPQLAAALPPTTSALMVAGGVAYSAGALCYAARGPNLWPGIGFGYHELFHVCVVLAAALHFAGVRVVVRAADAAAQGAQTCAAA